MDWFGLTHREVDVYYMNADMDYDEQSSYLSCLNDSDWTFEQIADIIEMGYVD